MDIFFDHPIGEGVRKDVLDELARIEQCFDVRVLYACESGSRGWGFASPDSDYDVRFIYVHQLPWYLRIENQRDVIERPISDKLDVSGWELRKALRLFRRSNPTLFEWLDSPIVYRSDQGIVARLRALAPEFYSQLKGRWHYLAIATCTYRESLCGPDVRLKRYLYALRALFAAQWIDAGLGAPPMRFASLAERMVVDTELREEINQLLKVKMASSEMYAAKRFPRIHGYIELSLAQQAIPEDFKDPIGEEAQLDALFLEILTGVCEGRHPA